MSSDITYLVMEKLFSQTNMTDMKPFIRAKQVSNCYIQEKKADRLCVRVWMFAFVLVSVEIFFVGFSVGYVLCAGTYSSTSIMW